MKLGPYLKDKREQDGITLKEMQEKSGIRKEIIKTIETGDFSKLPDENHARFLIRQYTSVLRLDGEELMERFSDDFDYDTKSTGKKRKQSDNEDYKYLRKVLVSFLVMILVLFVVWIVLLEVGSEAELFETQPIYETTGVEVDTGEESEEDAGGESEDSGDPGNDETADSGGDEESDTSSDVEINFNGVDNNTLFYQVTAPEGLTLGLDGNNSWVSLSDDLGNTYAYEELSEGEFDIEEEATAVYLTIGNADEFDVTLNGESLDDNQAEDAVTVYYQFNIETE